MAGAYKPTSRNWVKTWVDPWLEGTTRLEMNGAQRAFWIDVLALGGRSRIPGVVCSGETNGHLVGYPIPKLEALVMGEIDVEKTLKIFADTGKVTLQITQEYPIKLVIITICNWEKYQSEYHRQRSYRYGNGNDTSKVTREVTSQTTSGLQREVEVEVEVEVDSNTKNTMNYKSRTAARDAATRNFGHFWKAYPRKEGVATAQTVYLRMVGTGDPAPVLAGLERWKASEQWQEPRYIPHASKFLEEKKWLDAVPPPAARAAGAIANDAHVGEGPESRSTGKGCVICGRPEFFHKQKPGNRKRFEPKDDGHEFQAAP